MDASPPSRREGEGDDDDAGRRRWSLERHRQHQTQQKKVRCCGGLSRKNPQTELYTNISRSLRIIGSPNSEKQLGKHLNDQQLPDQTEAWEQPQNCRTIFEVWQFGEVSLALAFVASLRCNENEPTRYHHPWRPLAASSRCPVSRAPQTNKKVGTCLGDKSAKCITTVTATEQKYMFVWVSLCEKIYLKYD